MSDDFSTPAEYGERATQPPRLDDDVRIWPAVALVLGLLAAFVLIVWRFGCFGL